MVTVTRLRHPRPRPRHPRSLNTVLTTAETTRTPLKVKRTKSSFGSTARTTLEVCELKPNPSTASAPRTTLASCKNDRCPRSQGSPRRRVSHT